MMRQGMRRWGVVVGMLAAVTAWAPGVAQAVPVTYEFSGTVNAITSSLSGGPVAINDAITGFYTFEVSTSPDSCGSHVCLYRGAITDIGFTVGGYSTSGISGPHNYINIANDAPNYGDDHIIFQSFSAPLINGMPPHAFRLSVQGSSTIVSGVGLSATAPNLGSANEFQIYFAEGGGVAATGTLNSLTTRVAGVPEPSTVVPLALGIGIFMIWRMRELRVGQEG